MANANQSQPQVTFEQIKNLFGITDMNPLISVSANANVFSTNVFIPMEGNVKHKTYFYLSGMVKLVETFKARIDNSGLKDQGWMLFIYYDSMFDEYSSYNNSKYIPNNINNTENKLIKTNYGNNKAQLKQLLELYKDYLKIIRNNIDGKYSFVKLYSFNCVSLKRKEKGYLGHPSTFGSMVRFMPMFDPQIKRMFCINISHAISPRLCYLISEWVKSEKLLFEKKSDEYSIYNYTNIAEDIKSIFDVGILDLYNPRIPAGLFGLYKNKNIKIIDDRLSVFSEKINYLIKKYNSKENIKVFVYGIDEIILGFIFKHMSYVSNITVKTLLAKKKDIQDELEKKNIKDKIVNLTDFIENQNEENIYYYFISRSVYGDTKKIINVYYMLLSLHEDLEKNFLSNISNISLSEIIKQLIEENTTITFQDRSHLTIKYQPTLTEKQLEELKIQIDQLRQKFIQKLKETQPSLTDIVINYIILKNINLESSTSSSFFKDPIYINQLKKLDLYKFKLLYWIKTFKDFHRYESRSFMESIDQRKVIDDLYGCTVIELNDFDTLLSSFDEDKPLIILTKSEDDSEFDLVKEFPEYFTIMDSSILTTDYLVEYYRDPSKVLPIPYVMSEESQAGGKKKIRTIKKSKQPKRKLRLIKSVKIKIS
jgi:hypothetical protein